MRQAGNMKLTEPQKRALRHLAKFPDQWRGDTPVTKNCLNALKEKGLVKVAFEPDDGWCEMITLAGLEKIAKEPDAVPARKLTQLRQITLTLDGEQPISWNKMYSGQHWTLRNEEAARVHLAVRAALDPNWPMFDKPVVITVRIYFKNKRVQLDASNVPAKIYEDGLTGWLIEDDSPKFVRSMTTVSLIDRDNPRVEIQITEVSDG